MKVSICIPHYKQEDYLMSAVQSALDQVAPQDEIEVVVSDNASGDRAEPILRELEDMGPPVRVLRNTYNIGMVANFNRAVAASSGEIVCLLSADDELLPGAISAVCDEYRAGPDLTMVYGSIRIEEDGAPPVPWPPDFGPRQRFEQPGFARFNMKKPDTPLVSAYFRRDAFDVVGGFKGEAGPVTDWLFWTELGQVGSVLRIAMPLGLYRVHGTNETLSAKKSYAWILYHYLAESYGMAVAVGLPVVAGDAQPSTRPRVITHTGTGAISQAGTAASTRAGTHATIGPSRHTSYAERSSLGTVMSSLRKGKRSLARRQLLLAYCLWPSLRALGDLLGGIVLSFLPRPLVDAVYRHLRSRVERDRKRERDLDREHEHDRRQVLS